MIIHFELILTEALSVLSHITVAAFTDCHRAKDTKNSSARLEV